MELATKDDVAVEFVNGILPRDISREADTREVKDTPPLPPGSTPPLPPGSTPTV